MHWLEILQYANQELPTQIVVGHGGTTLIQNYVDQTVFPHLELHVGSKQQQLKGRVLEGLTSSSMFGFAIMERSQEGDYDMSFLGLDMKTNVMVQQGFNFTIPKGPRVAQTESSASSSGNSLHVFSKIFLF